MLPELVQQPLPFWPDEDRAAPTMMLQSALFGCAVKGERPMVKDMALATWGSVTIRYTGERLDQGDLDVWYELVHRSRDSLGHMVPVSAYSLLKAIGRSTGKTQYEWLKRSLKRLQVCGVEVARADGRGYQGPLVAAFAFSERERKYAFRLNPELAELFKNEGFTRVVFETRLKLKTDTARWLHNYINTHRATYERPHRVKLQTLHELIGSETKNMRAFRKRIRDTLEQLQEHGVVESWEVTDNDTVVIVRPDRNRQGALSFE
ncbi:putative Replication initiator protein A [Magnetofaba australis IT-1]|uniref:Putative Replication initiator protein A n=1 Tax=Magnetofaba australis IT-1 TaxID=1434232 RepID=A0A1Y2KA77_9PROT|nr:putative Replication initiator protein A [Magnetofaba australis IT-1]